MEARASPHFLRASVGAFSHSLDGKPKTEFPSSWSNDKIIDSVNRVATDPNIPTSMGKWNSPYKVGIIDGVRIRVDFYPTNHPAHAGNVSTSYPF